MKTIKDLFWKLKFRLAIALHNRVHARNVWFDTAQVSEERWTLVKYDRKQRRNREEAREANIANIMRARRLQVGQ